MEENNKKNKRIWIISGAIVAFFVIVSIIFTFNVQRNIQRQQRQQKQEQVKQEKADKHNVEKVIKNKPYKLTRKYGEDVFSAYIYFGDKKYSNNFIVSDKKTSLQKEIKTKKSYQTAMKTSHDDSEKYTATKSTIKLDAPGTKISFTNLKVDSKGKITGTLKSGNNVGTVVFKNENIKVAKH
jgi:uncharacterized membrane protein